MRSLRARPRPSSGTRGKKACQRRGAGGGCARAPFRRAWREASGRSRWQAPLLVRRPPPEMAPGPCERARRQTEESQKPQSKTKLKISSRLLSLCLRVIFRGVILARIVAVGVMRRRRKDGRLIRGSFFLLDFHFRNQNRGRHR